MSNFITHLDLDVVIPCRNDKESLRNAVLSVSTQTWLPKTCYVIDDGSDTPIVMEDFIHNPHLNLQIIRTEGVGVSSARNEGIIRSKSKYLAFLDSDDIWLPIKIETQYKLMESNEAIIACFTGCKVINPKTRRERILVPREGFVNTSEIISESVQITGSASSTVVRTQILRDIGGFDTKLDYAEDMDAWLRLSTKGFFYGIALVCVHIFESKKSSQRRLSEGAQAILALRYKSRILELYPTFPHEVQAQMVSAIARALAYNVSKYYSLKTCLKEVSLNPSWNMTFDHPVKLSLKILKKSLWYLIIRIILKLRNIVRSSF